MAKRRGRKRTRTTAKQRVASRRNLVQARKKRNRRIAAGAAIVGVGALTTAGVVARHKLSGSSFSKQSMPILNSRKEVFGSRKASFSVQKISQARGVNTRREVAFISKKQGPLGNSHRYVYAHKPLKVEQVLGKKLHNRLLASQHFANPFAPQYKRKSQSNYGSHGPRVPYEGPRKYIGGTEIFSELDARGKRVRTGFTSIGSAMSGRRG